ncbi:MAG: hypothetical protein QNJ15_12355 [Erythrobacter sp.]|nr:hypothetical protein [Erythrobacter sp.]
MGVTAFLDAIAWLVIGSPIWLSPILRLTWDGWFKSSWRGVASVNAIPLAFMLLFYGPAVVWLVLIFSPLLFAGLLVSILSMYWNRPNAPRVDGGMV